LISNLNYIYVGDSLHQNKKAILPIKDGDIKYQWINLLVLAVPAFDQAAFTVMHTHAAHFQSSLDIS